MNVDVAYSPDTDFSTWKTYAWRETKTLGDPNVDDAWVRERIRTNVDAELAAKGFKMSGKPDFYVTYAAVISEGTTASVDKYEIGTVVLKMIDPKIYKTVWRANSRDEIEQGARTAKRERRAKVLIAKMLESFPPG